KRWWHSDFLYALRGSPLAITSGIIVCCLILAAACAPLIAPYNAFDPATANLADARLPPGARGMSGDRYLFGTDPTGRDLLSAMIYGLRTSLAVGLGSVVLAACVGVGLGLLAGYSGGFWDALIMRLADIQLSIPPILAALLISGVTSAVFGRASSDELAIPILIFAISTSLWVQFARTVRAAVHIERGKDYILAAQITGVSPGRI